MTSSSSFPFATDLAAGFRTERATVSRAISGRRVELRFENESSLVEATVAAFGYEDPQAGDEVLALTDRDEVFVIGVFRALRALRALRELKPQSAPSTSPNSSPATVAADAQQEVRDSEGRLLFRYDPETGDSEVFIPHGDLRFRVDEGQLELQARDGVSLSSDATVELRSGHKVELSAGSEGEEDIGTVLVTRDRVGASAPELLLAAGKARLVAADLGIAGEQLEITAKQIRQVARVVETKAHRIVERTRDSYRTVERLAHLETGRLRTIAHKGVHLIGERVSLAAKKKMKIRGEKIYLA